MVTQIVRFKDIVTAEKIAKTLQNHTPSLPSGVKGITRLKGIVSAITILKLFPISYFLTNESGDYITDEGGNHFEILI